MRSYSQMMKKIMILLLLLMVSLAISGACTKVPERIESVSAWLVYWDAERALEELHSLGELFDKVSFFAYELDAKGIPVMAFGVEDNLERFFSLSIDRGYEPWVTVVNDVHYEDGVRAKDIPLISEILLDAERSKQHAVDLAEKVAVDGFVGLHLDYEQIPHELELEYYQFVVNLHNELTYRGLDLEIVVEPCSAPIPVVEDVPVIVMAYNLHGYHSGPGPVATPEFISSLSRCTDRIERDNLAIALSVHGFAWRLDGTIEAIDWNKAKLTNPKDIAFYRELGTDVPSRVSEESSVIWYEDLISVDAKWKAAEISGFSQLYIWKLGGLDDEFFAKVMDLKESIELNRKKP